jgi:putative transposase
MKSMLVIVNSQFGLANHKLAKSTSDSHWYEFKRQLEYKSSWYSKVFKIVNERWTSKTCSNCGYINSDMDLDVREWIYPECDIRHDRDINAVNNIQTVGTTGFAFGKTSTG